MIYWITGFFILLAALLLAVLFVPLQIRISAQNMAQQIRVNLISGLIGIVFERRAEHGYRLKILIYSKKLISVRLKERGERKKSAQKKKKKKDEPEAKKKRATLRKIFTTDWKRLKKPIGQLLRDLHDLNIRGRVQYGLRDPMQTGIIFAAYSAISEFIPAIKRSLQLIPSFTSRGVDWHVSVSTELRPVVVVWHGLLLYLSYRKISKTK